MYGVKPFKTQTSLDCGKGGVSFLDVAEESSVKNAGKEEAEQLAREQFSTCGL